MHPTGYDRILPKNIFDSIVPIATGDVSLDWFSCAVCSQTGSAPKASDSIMVWLILELVGSNWHHVLWLTFFHTTILLISGQ